MNNVSVLNAMVGCHNVVDSKQISNIMDGMLSTIGNILKDHCGPYGKLAMLPQPNPLAEPVFTKDGINIVNAIECVNDVEKVTKSLIAYIGGRVERKAGDGTTTAMLLSVNLLKQFRSLLDKYQIDYNGFVVQYKKTIDDILSEYSKRVVKNNNPPISAREIVLRQAFTSSHGDIELSNMVANVLSSVPSENIDNLMFVCSRKETNNIYSTVKNDSSFSTEAIVFDTRMYNSVVGNGVELEDGTLVVTSTGLFTNSVEYLQLKEMLSSLTTNDKPVVVITGSSLDNRVTSELLELHDNKRREGIRFYMFRVKDNHPKVNALNGLFAVMGHDRDAMMDTSILCDFTKLRYDEGVLYIYSDDMVGYDENDVCIKHCDTDTPVGKFIEVCHDYIENNNVVDEHSVGLAGTLDIAKWLLSTVKYKSYEYFVIGGGGYDNRAAIDILTDVLKSSRSALKYGIASAGLVNLAQAARIIHNKYTHDKQRNIWACRISECILKAIVETRITILTTYKKIKRYRARSLVYTNVDINESPLNIEASETFISTKETLTRFGEVATRYLFTSNVMIPGGVFVPEEKLNK